MVTRKILLFIAGLVWMGAGSMLLIYSFSWLAAKNLYISIAFSLLGLLVALFAKHFIFRKIVEKNVKRIQEMKDNQYFFNFMTWKSCVIIIIMIIMGTMLRNSRIPKHNLAVLYMGMGLALIFSSWRYFKEFLKGNLYEQEINRE